MDAVERDRIIHWPPDSNRDSIARELDSLRLSRNQRLALRTIFDLQWPPNAPADFRPGHKLVEITLAQLKQGTGLTAKGSVLKIPGELHAAGCIDLVSAIGKPHLISICWDALFGVDSAWRSGERSVPAEVDRFNPATVPVQLETKPVQSQNCTGSISDEPKLNRSSLKTEPVQSDLMSVLNRIAVALETIAATHVRTLGVTQSSFSPAPCDEGRLAGVEAKSTSANFHSEPVQSAFCTGSVETVPVQSEDCTGSISDPLMIHELMKEFNSLMNHDHDSKEPPEVYRYSDKTEPVQSVPVQSKLNRSGKDSDRWAFPDPYYRITEDHLKSPFHLERMLEIAISIGKWSTGEAAKAEWFELARFALAGDSPGAAFKGGINFRLKGRSRRGPVPAVSNETTRSPPSLHHAIALMSDDQCLAILKGRKEVKEVFLSERSAGKDPKLHPIVFGELRRILRKVDVQKEQRETVQV